MSRPTATLKFFELENQVIVFNLFIWMLTSNSLQRGLQRKTSRRHSLTRYESRKKWFSLNYCFLSEVNQPKKFNINRSVRLS